MVKVEDVFSYMKLKDLYGITNMLNLNIKQRKKAEVVSLLSNYIQDNIYEILLKFIIDDELEVLRDICIKDYSKYIDSYDSENISIKSLCKMGILYLEKDDNGMKVCIPYEIQESIKKSIDDKCIIEFSENRGNIIRLFNKLLNLYGAFSLNVLEDYLTQEIGYGYRIHKAIETIRLYNDRSNIYYQDDNMIFYSCQIENLELIKNRIYAFKHQYKYYSNDELDKLVDVKSKAEDDICIILTRVYKNPKPACEIVKEIKFMMRQGRDIDEIRIFIKDKAKRISDFGLKSICKSLECMRDDYIVWGYKGYQFCYAKEMQKEVQCL